jgi:hypothetical protein
MTIKHLRINKTEAACGNLFLSGMRLVGPDNFDDINCDDCKETPFYAAA